MGGDAPNDLNTESTREGNDLRSELSARTESPPRQNVRTTRIIAVFSGLKLPMPDVYSSRRSNR